MHRTWYRSRRHRVLLQFRVRYHAGDARSVRRLRPLITQAQARLVSHLIRLIANDSGESQRRWGVNAALATRYASEREQLLLAREWTADLTLLADGSVLFIDTENGEPPRSAGESERRGALFRSIAEFPELLSLLPSRPPDAVTCPSCEGTGVVEVSLQNRTLRNLLCACSGAGWVPSARTGA
jgi:hypothetical protein